MNIAKIDNGIKEELGNVILWQYDKAWNLLSIIRMLHLFHDSATKSFWDRWILDVFCQFEKDDSGAYKYDANTFGLSVWGIIIGIPRPIINKDTGEAISIDFYRRLLDGWFTIYLSNFSTDAICAFADTVYQGRMTVTDNFDMTITITDNGFTTEESAIVSMYIDIAFPFPAAVRTREKPDKGIVFAFEGQASDDDEYPKTDTFDNANFITSSY